MTNSLAGHTARACLTRHSFGNEKVRRLGTPCSDSKQAPLSHSGKDGMGTSLRAGRPPTIPAIPIRANCTCSELPPDSGWPCDDSDQQDAVTAPFPGLTLQRSGRFCLAFLESSGPTLGMTRLSCWRNRTYGGSPEEIPTTYRGHVKNRDAPADSTKAPI